MATPFDRVTGITLVTPPAIEPITLAQAKNHLRVDIPDDDTLITTYIMAARIACEAFIHGSLITQTWRVSYNGFPDDFLAAIAIPVEPLQSVVSFKWWDQNYNLTTMTVATPGPGPFLATDYILDTDSEPGRIVPPPNSAWPGVSLWPVSPIQITVMAGFGADGTSVPAPYINGMLMCIAHWYEHRAAIETSGAVPKEVPMGAEYSWWIGGRYWHLK